MSMFAIASGPQFLPNRTTSFANGITATVIIAGTADRMAHPNHAHSLWHHWQHPKIYWFPGNHLVHFEKTHYMREVVAFLRGLGLY